MANRGHTPEIIYPAPIQYRRFARNGRLVQGHLFSRIAYAQNHILGFRRKWVASYSQKGYGSSDGGSGANTVWRGYFHSGHCAKHIEIKMILGFAQDNGAVDPTVVFRTTNPTTGAQLGIATTHLNSIQQGRLPIVAPDDYRVFTRRIEIDEDTRYGFTVATADFGHPLSCAVYEVGYARLPFTSTGTCDPDYSTGDPVLDDPQADIYTGQDEILRTNRPQLLSHSKYNDSYTITSTSYINVLDNSLSTAGNAAEPGFRIRNRYHNTASRTDVPVVFAAYVDRTASGDCHVKLDSGSDSIVITVDSDTAGWYTATGTIPANSSSTKYDVHAKVAASGTMDVYAWTLFEYE